MIDWRAKFKTCVRWAWLVLQSFSLLAILFTPLWIQSQRDSRLSKEVPAAQALETPAVIAEKSSGEERRGPANISSKVIQIQSPASGEPSQRGPAASRSLEKRLEIDSRQLRFEWSVDAESENVWKLESIQRVHGDQSLSEIALLKDHRGTAIGSVYVELESEEDVFIVKMFNRKDKTEQSLRYFLRASKRLLQNR
jgi:hypothetical protein